MAAKRKAAPKMNRALLPKKTALTESEKPKKRTTGTFHHGTKSANSSNHQRRDRKGRFT